MKETIGILTILFVIGFLFISGCTNSNISIPEPASTGIDVSESGEQATGTVVTESDAGTTKEYPVSGFSKILVTCLGKVILTQGSPESVQISGDKDAIEQISVSTEGKTLVITENYKNLKIEPVTIKVTAPEFTEIESKGSGSIRSDGELQADSMKLYIEGAGEQDLSIKTKQLSSSITGSGKITLSGSADNHAIYITGAGLVKAYDLNTKTTSVKIDEGSGETDISAQDTLDVEISRGSGEVKYHGDPKVTKNIHEGSGEVRKTG